MLATLIPLFDEKMEVCSYSIFAQKENYLLRPTMQSTSRYDNAGNVVGLEIIDSVGTEALSGNKELFIEMNEVSIYADLGSQCNADHNHIVLLIGPSIKPQEEYIERLKALKEDGYKLAMRKLLVAQFEEYKEILKLCDYILLNHQKIDISKARIYFNKMYPEMKLCAVNVNSQLEYDRLKEIGGYDLYEGEFFRIPVVKNDQDVAPLKANYINLLNVVNNSNFELTEAADIISQDPALMISMLEMVNKMTVSSGITSVRQAAALLGQKELKKWITTAVTKELCADKPSEIARMSMMRAKFAENLATSFEMPLQASELFLMGLFSNIDVMLGKPMEEALGMVVVSDNIKEALLDKTGKFYPVMDFIRQYENANWQEISRQLLLLDIDMNVIYEAYLNSLSWYRDLLSIK
ncbi:MAG: HDOD domain-containing protein [Butyrivibrio sp.]|nr:HDOD domain-containing protein [Butyrivibrio sp.]